MNRYIFLLILMICTIFTIVLPNETEAHNGKRDELGGHFKRTDCTYLLHSPTSLVNSAKNIDELIGLIQTHNSNSDCSSALVEDKVNLEGHSFTSTTKTPVTTSTEKTESNTSTTLDSELKLGQTYAATLEKCVDGDTANFIINGQVYKTRFLYIDTPESTRQVEPFGKEASEYTCAFLNTGEITLETDGNTLYDKYNRLLAWVVVDGKLHQEAITKAGLVEDFYDFGDYKYESLIVKAMQEAKANYVGIYESLRPETSTEGSSTENEKQLKNPSTKKEAENKPITSKDKEYNKNEETLNNESTTSEQVNSKSITEEGSDSSFSALLFIIFVIVVVFIFFKTPAIKVKRGTKPLIAHKLRSKKKRINLLLFFVYSPMWFILLFIIIIEFIHLGQKTKQRPQVEKRKIS